MKYRIQLDFAFDGELEAKAFWILVKRNSKKAVNFSDEEKKSASIHRCYHDTDPTKPCEIIEEIKSE